MVRMSRLIAMTTGQINVNPHALVQILQGQITQAHVDEVQGVKSEELLALCLLLKQDGNLHMTGDKEQLSANRISPKPSRAGSFLVKGAKHQT